MPLVVLFCICISVSKASAFVCNVDNVLETIALNRESFKDTTGLYFYSFGLQKIMKYGIKKTDEEITIINACLGDDVLLSAPDYGNKASYEWKGPTGRISEVKDLHLSDVNKSLDGIFSLIVKFEDQTVYGRVRLKIKEKPNVQASNTKQFSENEYVSLQVQNPNNQVNYQWLNDENVLLSTSTEVLLSQHPVGIYRYKLQAEKDGCVSTSETKVKVVSAKRTVRGNSIETGRGR